MSPNADPEESTLSKREDQQARPILRGRNRARLDAKGNKFTAN